MRFASVISLCLLSILQLAAAHSWVEEVRRIGANGAYVGPPGYPRGGVDRQDPNFQDGLFVHLLPQGSTQIDAAADINKYQEQVYTDKRPMLKAVPGDLVALQYQENGHVSLPDAQPGKPLNRGTVFIYGTSEARGDDKFLDIHKQWTPDGKGGDGRGRLLATRNYDDGFCRQTNADEIATFRSSEFPKEAKPPMGADLWCQNDIQLPDDLEEGSIFTVYWVWDWPTLNPGPVYDQSKSGIYPTQNDPAVKIVEVYSSTVDIEIVSESDLGLGTADPASADLQSQGSQEVGQVSKISLTDGFEFDDSVDRGERAILEQIENPFQVNVTFASENNAPDNEEQPAPEKPTQEQPVASPTSNQTSQTTEAATTTPEGDRAGRTKTVTKTMEPTTVLSFITVTVPAGGQTPDVANSQGQSAPAETSDNVAPKPTDDPPLVEPFMPRRGRLFRA